MKIMYNELVGNEEISIDNTALETIDGYLHLGPLIMCFTPPRNQYKDQPCRWKSIMFNYRMPIHLKKKTIDQCVIPASTCSSETNCNFH